MATIFLNKTKKESLPKRHTDDVYVTEPNLIRAVANTFVAHYPRRFHSILDIGAGDGRWGNIMATAGHEKRANTIGVELRNLPSPKGFDVWCPNQDFLTWEYPYSFDLIVSNPPYKYAEEIVRKGYSMLHSGGRMIMLLPLAFMSSYTRYMGLWAELAPINVAVLSRRPSFYNNKTSGDEFGVYVWDKRIDGYNAGMPRNWRTSLLYFERGGTLDE